MNVLGLLSQRQQLPDNGGVGSKCGLIGNFGITRLIFLTQLNSHRKKNIPDFPTNLPCDYN